MGRAFALSRISAIRKSPIRQQTPAAARACSLKSRAVARRARAPANQGDRIGNGAPRDRRKK